MKATMWFLLCVSALAIVLPACTAEPVAQQATGQQTQAAPAETQPAAKPPSPPILSDRQARPIPVPPPAPAKPPVPPTPADQHTHGAPAPSTPAAKPEGRPPAPRNWLLEECEKIAAAVGLTDQQRMQVEANIQAFARAAAKWRAANELEFQALAEKIQQARKARDRAAIRKLEVQIKPLLVERNKIFDDPLSVIMSVLTDQQHVALEASRLQRTAMRKYEPTGLSEQQKARIQGLATIAAAARLKVKTHRKRTAIRKKFLDSAFWDVLTGEQRITFMADKLNNSAMAIYAKADLTSQQKVRVYEMCRKIGARQLKVTAWRPEANLRRVLLYQLYHQVLTDQQKSKVKKPITPRPIKPQPPAATSPAGAAATSRAAHSKPAP